MQDGASIRAAWLITIPQENLATFPWDQAERRDFYRSDCRLQCSHCSSAETRSGRNRCFGGTFRQVMRGLMFGA